MKNKRADQPEHQSCLIGTFAIRLLENFISTLATGEISLLLLVSVAEHADFGMTLSETPKTGFRVSQPICLPSFTGN